MTSSISCPVSSFLIRCFHYFRRPTDYYRQIYTSFFTAFEVDRRTNLTSSKYIRCFFYMRCTQHVYGDSASCPPIHDTSTLFVTATAAHSIGERRTACFYIKTNLIMTSVFLTHGLHRFPMPGVPPTFHVSSALPLLLLVPAHR